MVERAVLDTHPRVSEEPGGLGQTRRGPLLADGLVPAGAPEEADLLVVNTCAFIEPARQESVETILELHAVRRPGAGLVVTGCLAERWAESWRRRCPRSTGIAGFGRVARRRSRLPSRRVSVTLGGRSSRGRSFDLLELPAPPASAPWAYSESGRRMRPRCVASVPSPRSGVSSALGTSGIWLPRPSLWPRGGPGGQGPVHEIVLVAQDLASYGRDRSTGRGARAASGSTPSRRSSSSVRTVSPLSRPDPASLSLPVHV